MPILQSAASATSGLDVLNALTASQDSPTITVTDPTLASALSKIAGQATQGTAASVPSGDKEEPTYKFVAGWILLIVLLTVAAKTRVGYVIIYYSLMLIILLILVTEYQQIAPLLNVQTIGVFNSSNTI